MVPPAVEVLTRHDLLAHAVHAHKVHTAIDRRAHALQGHVASAVAGQEANPALHVVVLKCASNTRRAEIVRKLAA